MRGRLRPLRSRDPGSRRMRSGGSSCHWEGIVWLTGIMSRPSAGRSDRSLVRAEGAGRHPCRDGGQ